MTEVKEPLRVLIYDIGDVQFPEFQEELDSIGRDIIHRHRIAQNRLIDTVFKQVFGIDMTDEANRLCVVVKVSDGLLIMYRGRPFLLIGEMIEEDPIQGVPSKVYLEYEVIS